MVIKSFSLLCWTTWLLSQGSSHGLDPFWPPVVVEEGVRQYLERKPITTERPRQGWPLALRLEMVKLPQFAFNDVTIADAVASLKQKAREADPKNGGFDFLLNVDELSSNRITISLQNVSVLEALREIVRLGGSGFDVLHQQIVIGGGDDGRNLWRKVAPANFVISESLAHEWFPEAKANWRGDSDTLVAAEATLGKLGIVFHADAQADFVPSMNCLAVIHCTPGMDCLRVLIEESEHRLRLQQLRKEASLPKGWALKSLSISKDEPGLFKRVLFSEKGILHPRSVTTNDALRFYGILFGKDAVAWYDRGNRRLHVFQTEERLQAVERLLSGL
jgi:hypothetical protein